MLLAYNNIYTVVRTKYNDDYILTEEHIHWNESDSNVILWLHIAYLSGFKCKVDELW